MTTEHPLAILSENNFEHLLLMLAGQHVGVPPRRLRRPTRSSPQISASCGT